MTSREPTTLRLTSFGSIGTATVHFALRPFGSYRVTVVLPLVVTALYTAPPATIAVTAPSPASDTLPRSVRALPVPPGPPAPPAPSPPALLIAPLTAPMPPWISLYPP